MTGSLRKEDDMKIAITVPISYEVQEATVEKWYKKIGDSIVAGDSLLDCATEKVVIEIPAPADGVLLEIIAKDGESVFRPEHAPTTGNWDATVGYMETGNTP